MKVHEALAALPAHQQRVVAEKIELDAKRERLRLFIGSSMFTVVAAAEQERMRDQLKVMDEYSHILAERIIHF